MNPSDFLSLAHKMSAADSSEASQRSAVSRAYYGAFHEAKSLIESSCGFKFSSSGETHSKLPFCMDQSGDADIIAAGNKLNTLRNIRNDADYELADTKFSKKAFVSMQIAVAQQIANDMLAAKSRASIFRPKVRKYARDTLKKTLQGTD